ncbi:cupin domain-containing protein [Deinococcus peraridilitoris]|nr:cupin domain-containing protein [Deinococcus peraridilitoris]
MTNQVKATVYSWNDVAREQVNEQFARQLISGEKVMLAQLELKAGCIVPRHVHDNEQLSMAFSGAIKLVLGENEEQEFILRAGDVLVIPGGLPHRAEVLEDFSGLDVFSPPRQDWLNGSDSYLRR